MPRALVEDIIDKAAKMFLLHGRDRHSTLTDLHDFTRLQDALDMFDLDVNTTYVLIANTTKPVATAFTIADHVDPIVHMLDIAAGGTG